MTLARLVHCRRAGRLAQRRPCRCRPPIPPRRFTPPPSPISPILNNTLPRPRWPLRPQATTSTFRRRWPGNTSSRRHARRGPHRRRSGPKRQSAADGPLCPGRRRRSPRRRVGQSGQAVANSLCPDGRQPGSRRSRHQQVPGPR